GFIGSGNLGEQVRGFGLVQDCAVDTLFDFINPIVFQNLTDPLRRNLESFILGLDTGLNPIVGQQVSITPATFNDNNVTNRIDLLIARADAGDCDLVVKGIVTDEARGALYVGGNQFQFDRDGQP